MNSHFGNLLATEKAPLKKGAFFVPKNRKVIVLCEIICTKKRCLNNCKGKCKAAQIYYDGLCQTYATARNGMQNKAGRLVKRGGRYKEPPKNVLK